MQDLEVINRLNAEAVEAAIPKEVAAGKFVVGKYTGLHFVDYGAYPTEGERNQAAITWTNAGPSHRVTLHNPTK